MNKIKKKKLKLKKRNITILILLLILIIISLIIGINSLQNKDKNINKPKENKKEQITSISFYKKEYKERYQKYKKENPNLTDEQVVTHVNIGLDYNYYENTKPTKLLNSEKILVNKYNYLTEDYIPENLEDISLDYSRSGMRLVNYAKDAFEDLAENAKKDNMNIIAMSSYRSYKYQVNLYNRYKEQDGQEAADTYSARAGFSEHQTGLAVDIYNGKKDYTDFEETEEFNWMQENAYKYGFILRFPKNKVKETGYQYESWHYRYVGKEIAKYIHENNLCYEEYYATKNEE